MRKLPDRWLRRWHDCGEENESIVRRDGRYYHLYLAPDPDGSWHTHVELMAKPVAQQYSASPYDDLAYEENEEAKKQLDPFFAQEAQP